MIQFIRALLGLANLSPADKVTAAQNIKDSMQSSGNFPASSMPISYPTLQTYITNLHLAIIAAVNGTPSDTAYMHEQEHILVSALNFLKSHVEYVANANSVNTNIITSAGMQIASTGGNSAVSELTLEAIGNGKLQIRVPRQTGEKAFVFESSTDGVTWVEFASNSLTKITLSNQTPGSTVYIRFAAISKTGKGALSQSKSAIVL
jgi:molybdopterin-binding protein